MYIGRQSLVAAKKSILSVYTFRIMRIETKLQTKKIFNILKLHNFSCFLQEEIIIHHSVSE